MPCGMRDVRSAAGTTIDVSPEPSPETESETDSTRSAPFTPPELGPSPSQFLTSALSFAPLSPPGRRGGATARSALGWYRDPVLVSPGTLAAEP